MKNSLKLGLLFLFIIPVTVFLFYQKKSKLQIDQQTEITNGQDRLSYSFQFQENKYQPLNIINDSIYTQDSFKFIEFEKKAWKYYFNTQWDSVLHIALEATVWTEKSLQNREDSLTLRMNIMARGWAGQGKFKTGNYEKGLQEMIESMNLFVEKIAEYDLRLAEGYVGLGSCYAQLGDYEMAIHYNHKSEHVMNHVFKENHYYFGNKYSNLGNLYLKLDDYDKALEYFQKELNNFSITVPGSIARPLLHIAEAYLKKGDIANAMDYAKQSIQFPYQGNEDIKRKSLGYSHALLGEIYTKMGEFLVAKTHIRKALGYHSAQEKISVKQAMSLINDYNLLGDIYLKENKIDSALHSYQESLDMATKFYGDRSLTLIRLHNNIGKAYVQQKDYNQALQRFQQSLNIIIPNLSKEDFHQNPSIENVSPTAKLLSMILLKASISKKMALNKENSKNELLCLSTYQFGDQLFDKMLQGYTNQKSKTFLRTKARLFYEEAIGFCMYLYKSTGDQQYFDLGFYYLEKSKSIILLAGLQKSKATQFSGIENELTASESQTRKELSLYNKLIFEENQKEHPDSIKLGFWFNTVLKLKYANDSIMQLIQKNHPKYYQLQHNLRVTNIRDLQQELDKQSAIIEYMLGDSSLSIFTITQNDVYFHQQALEDKLFSQLESLQNNLYDYQPNLETEEATKSTFNTFTENTHWLYQYLLEPALNKIDVENLIIIPDGALGYLPFQTLLSKRAKEGKYDYRNLSYLFLDYTIRYEYSATLLFEEYPRRKNQHIYAGFGPEYEGNELLTSRNQSDSQLVAQLYPQVSRDGLSSLQYNQPEIRESAQTIGGIAYISAEASEGNFKREAPNSEIIHLAVHALTNDEAPLYSQLIFSKSQDTLEDGYLHAYELYNMKFNSNLAVLSACNTGNGKLQKGEGIMSLSRAFKYAGCPNIVMSLWKADDLSTKKIITSFFEHLKEGEKKPGALQKARKDYLFNVVDDKLTHPYYWATFILIGDDKPINLGDNYKYWWLLAGGLFIFSLWLWKKKKV